MNQDLINQEFSLWCDFLQRDFLQTGFKELVKSGKILGATSNPSIFANAFKNSQAYQKQILSMQEKSAKEIYETLAIEDIQMTAEILRPLWEKNQNDGYVSLEIDPLFCDDAKESIAEGKRLFERIDRPNVMIKVPATHAGFGVMEELLANHIPINATLIFSPSQAQSCLEAFKRARARGGKGKSVLSVFVSRLDRAVDSSLAKNLRGKLGIYNAKYIYRLIEDFGDRENRTLFASTGVKGDEFIASYYINELLLPHSVNTAPLESIEAYFQHNDTQIKSSQCDLEGFLKQCPHLQIEDIYQKLLNEGLEAFKQSFKTLLASLKH